MRPSIISFKNLLLGFSIELFILPIRGYLGGWGYAGIAAFILYFLAYLYFSNRDLQSIRSLTIAFLIPAVLMNIVPRIFMQGTVASLPELPAHFLGILAGYLFYTFKKQTIYKYGIFIFLYGITLFFCTAVLKTWLFKINFGTYNGLVTEYYPGNFPIETEYGVKKDGMKELQGKIVLFDFWNSRCGACFKAFPKLQTFYDRHKNNTDLLIYAANYPLKGDSANQYLEVIREYGYSFPVIKIEDKDILKKFDFQFFPTAFVMNKNGQVIYKGNIDGASKLIEKML